MLTAKTVLKAEPKDKEYVLYDAENLYLKVRPSGSKTWIIRVMKNGKIRVKSLGQFPGVTLAKAREMRDNIIDSMRSNEVIDNMSFQDVAEAWLKRKSSSLSPHYANELKYRLGKYILPYIGSRSVSEIKRKELVMLVLKIADDGREDTANRVSQLIDAVFQHALNAGFIEHSPAQYLAKALPTRAVKVQHFKSVTEPSDIAKVMKALHDISSFQTRTALLMVAYTFVRVGELLRARLAEFNLKDKVWVIPAEHMKRRLELVVPLSSQVVALVSEVLDFNSSFAPRSELLFPCLRPRGDKHTSITEASLLKALKVMCWQKPGTPAMTIHGFRSMASSVLNGHGWNPDAIERQLAHVPTGVRGIYNRAEYMNIRISMMQWYADYLDALKMGKNDPPLPEFARN